MRTNEEEIALLKEKLAYTQEILLCLLENISLSAPNQYHNLFRTLKEDFVKELMMQGDYPK